MLHIVKPILVTWYPRSAWSRYGSQMLWLGWHLYSRRPPDLNKSNVENHIPFLKCSILKLDYLWYYISLSFKIRASVASQIETGMLKDLICEIYVLTLISYHQMSHPPYLHGLTFYMFKGNLFPLIKLLSISWVVLNNCLYSV